MAVHRKTSSPEHNIHENNNFTCDKLTGRYFLIIIFIELLSTYQVDLSGLSFHFLSYQLIFNDCFNPVNRRHKKLICLAGLSYF